MVPIPFFPSFLHFPSHSVFQDSGTVRYILTIFYACMRHILSQFCLAASHFSRCVAFSVQVSSQTNIWILSMLPFPFTATSLTSLVGRRDGWSWTRTTRCSEYQLLRWVGTVGLQWGIGGYGASIWGRFQYRELQIAKENNTFSESIQNIWQVQMMTKKCRWRRKRTYLGWIKAGPHRKKSAKGMKSHLASEFWCNRYPPMSAEILRRFAAEHRVDFHWAGLAIWDGILHWVGGVWWC